MCYNMVIHLMEQTCGIGAQAAVKMQGTNNLHTTFNSPFSASVFYCPVYDVPVVTPTSQIDEVTGKGDCPLCGGATKYLATDLRPVFPEERRDFSRRGRLPHQRGKMRPLQDVREPGRA